MSAGVCHRLRLFIVERSMTVLKFISCLTQAGFECGVRPGMNSTASRSGRGRPGPASSVPSVGREVLDLGRPKRASSERASASAVRKAEILWGVFSGALRQGRNCGQKSRGDTASPVREGGSRRSERGRAAPAVRPGR